MTSKQLVQFLHRFYICSWIVPGDRKILLYLVLSRLLYTGAVTDLFDAISLADEFSPKGWKCTRRGTTNNQWRPSNCPPASSLEIPKHLSFVLLRQVWAVVTIKWNRGLPTGSGSLFTFPSRVWSHNKSKFDCYQNYPLSHSCANSRKIMKIGH